LTGTQLRTALGLPHDAPLLLQTAAVPLMDISSRDLRQRITQGRSVRYFVPRAVEVYIQEKKLYQSGRVD
jgi:nicotinate-nucleotide adenylyltransferase